MDIKIMKKHKVSLMGRVLGIMMLVAGVQWVWAQNPTCKGTVYFKAPSEWSGAYIGGFNVNTLKKMTLNSDGYYEYDLSALGIQDNLYFAIGNSATGATSIVTRLNFAVAPRNANDANWPTNEANISCPGAGKVIYVTEDPLRPGKTYLGEQPSDAKYFYVLVPDEKVWQSDDMMIHYEIGTTKKDTAMTPAKDMCGWFAMVFKQAPSNVYMYLKNSPDMQLGLKGLWGEDETTEPVDLSLLYEAYGVNNLYFIPDDNDWPDGSEADMGWFVSDPGVPEAGDNTRCSFSLAAVIYDTDMSLNEVFTDCCSDAKNPAGPYEACVGVQYGLVKTDLGPDNKPVYSGSPNAVKCFGNEANFNKLFNYTPNVNEVQCYDMPFRHYGTDTRWGFDSDSMVTNDLVGGFYPLEESDDAGVVTLTINGVPTLAGPTRAARTRRPAAGPVPNNAEEVLGVDLDHYCKTPGFPSGADCEGKFADGEDLNRKVGGQDLALWCWGSYCDASFMRWGYDSGDNYAKNEKRNQHFCFESHATFTYNESQEFTFRGDDDIWVFINKKLAVDNGGAHLAAPGHVVLKNLNTTYGAGFLVPGKDYPIDIFFCDRRTTMSNVIIKTNMYIKQSTGLDFDTQDNGDAGLKMNICVTSEGGGDCASVALGSGGSGASSTMECGPNISANINYTITTRKGDLVATLVAGKTERQYGGFDLSNPKVPVVYPNEIIGLPPGNYRLYFEVNGKKSYYSFRVKGNLGVVANDVEFFNTDNEPSVYPNGTKWTFQGKAMAGTRIPVYISAPDGQGGVDLISAKGQNYIANISEGALVYPSADATTPVASLSGTIGESGIDTLWIEVPLSGLGADPQKAVTVSVGSTSAALTFLAPQITFANPAKNTDGSIKLDANGNVAQWNPTVGDPDVDEDGEEYFHWVNSDVDLYLVAMNPVTGDLCKECTFLIADIIQASDNISGGVSEFQDGVALVRIKSGIEYSTTAASIVVASIDNASIAAVYGNMHFYKPPAPMPQVVDIFDVRGRVRKGLEIPSPYHEDSREYLDGRGDSIAITYEREIHPDSIPSFICVSFDEKNLVEINPYEKGLSNNSKDNSMKCSYQFDAAQVKAAYQKSTDKRVIGLVADTAFSSGIKTTVKPENKIYSFTEYIWKGKPVKTFFEKHMTDRIAPVILSAQVMPQAEGSTFDILTVAVSEPVKLDENFQMEGFHFYLNSATELSASARYRASRAQNGPSVKDTIKIRFANNDPQNPSPHVGDLIRFRTEGKANMWSDTVTLENNEYRPSGDASMNWNSPTDYVDGGARLASPWVALEGAAKVDDASINYGYADPTKRNDPPIQAFLVPQKFSLQDVKDSFPNTLGKYLRTDMKSLKNSSEQFKNVKPEEVYFQYEMDIFTNLGGFVTHKSEKIECTDPKYFPGVDAEGKPNNCFNSNQNFYISWNMATDKHRLVGSGAYIVKWNSYVYLGVFKKKNKMDGTEVWGVRRPPKKKK